jgi:hypothetical protein
MPDLPSTRLGGLLCESAEGGIGSAERKIDSGSALFAVPPFLVR